MQTKSHSPFAQRLRLLAPRCSTSAAHDELVRYAIEADETIDALLDLIDDYRATLVSLNDALEQTMSQSVKDS